VAKRVNPGPAMVRRQSAVLAAAVALLAGIFLGFAGGNVVFNAEHAHAPAATGPAASAPGPAAMAPGMSAQVQAMEEAAARNPGDAAGWVALGNLYFDLENPAKSVQAYQRALAINPGQADVWTDMGVMERALGKPREALAAFDKAIAINPRHEVARMNTGVVYLNDLRDKLAALAAWRELLAVSPEARMPDGKRVADVVRELSAQAK
jgi:tetratricopeptide (TPR) repeat protein